MVCTEVTELLSANGWVRESISYNNTLLRGKRRPRKWKIAKNAQNWPKICIFVGQNPSLYVAICCILVYWCFFSPRDGISPAARLGLSLREERESNSWLWRRQPSERKEKRSRRTGRTGSGSNSSVINYST